VIDRPPTTPSAGLSEPRLTRSERLRRERAARRRMQRSVSIATRVLCAALAIMVLLGSGWAWATYTSFRSSISTVNIAEPSTSTHPSDAPKRDIDGKDENILVTGNDSRIGATPSELAEMSTQDDGGGINTDTIMILHIPADGTKATVISFPRDTYVKIPGHDPNKLNAVYHDGLNDTNGDPAGGARLLIQTLQNLTGLTIDHYVSIGFLGFLRLSKALDGVSVNLCAPQNPQTDSDENGSGYSGINLPAGWSTIEGKQALAFVRQRHGIPGGDIGRIKRQQYFLSQAFKKMTSAGTLTNPARIQAILHAIGSTLIMDPALAKDPMQLIQRFSDMAAGNVNFATIPNDGNTTNEVGWVFLSDPAEVRNWTANLIGHPADPALADAELVPPASVTVDVTNATGSDGIGTSNGKLLVQLGFRQGAVTRIATALPVTTIEYPQGQQGAAKTVAAHVPGAQLDLNASVKRVTLILGQNGKQVAAPVAAATPSKSAPASAPSTSNGVTNAQQITAGCVY
jgi:LCP family protein required for cell wall assembly